MNKRSQEFRVERYLPPCAELAEWAVAHNTDFIGLAHWDRFLLLLKPFVSRKYNLQITFNQY